MLDLIAFKTQFRFGSTIIAHCSVSAVLKVYCMLESFFAAVYAEASVKPSVLQNRFYEDSDYDKEIRKFCASKGIFYQSFWTLTANGKEQQDSQNLNCISMKSCIIKICQSFDHF